ncbi:MAG: hypothetical protein ACHQ7M_21800 [Chloroflexota bacterium]
MNLATKADIEQSNLSIIVTRADGTVEDLGVVSFWHRDPVKRLLWESCKQAGIRIGERDVLHYSALDFLKRLSKGV